MSTDNKNVKEAQDRLKRCLDWENRFRVLYESDTRFANGDSDNRWQWPNEVLQTRDNEKKPCLTINMVRQHNLQIINDAKKNKPGIAIRGTGGGATYESAQMLTSLIRHIEYQSAASVAYDVATETQVVGGVGYWRVTTEYCDVKSFDQDIFIRPIYNPLSVLLDPDARERDKSDMRFAFIYEDVPRDEFDVRYPEYKDKVHGLVGKGDDWISAEHVRVCEYFRKVEKKIKLYMLPDGTTMTEKDVPKELRARLKETAIKDRDTIETVIECLMIVGDEQIDEPQIWPGKFIPIVQVVGEETVTEHQLDRKGHTRAMKDAQRMYNYWSSSAVEFGALQTKTPWIGAAESIEGYETYWNTANTENFSLLAYKSRDDAGNELPPPQRVQPPVSAPVCVDGMQIAQVEMMRVSGQFQAQLGEQGNERSAMAITERQRQGDTATYHFIDNLAIAIARTGRIILDLIPKIYDTERLIMVQAEDGQDLMLKLDPEAKQAFALQQQENQETAVRILNPNLGKYDVEADVGPAYATQREAAFKAFTLILTQAPQLASILGDILFSAGDFPKADEAARRLRRMVPKEALGEGPSPQEQQLSQENQNLKNLLNQALDQVAIVQAQLEGVKADKQVDLLKTVGDHKIGVFDAVTKRLNVLMSKNSREKPMDEQQLVALLKQAVQEAMSNPVDNTLQ